MIDDPLRAHGGMDSDSDPIGGLPVPTVTVLLSFPWSLLVSSQVSSLRSTEPQPNHTIADCPRSVTVPTTPTPLDSPGDSGTQKGIIRVESMVLLGVQSQCVAEDIVLQLLVTRRKT